MDLISTAQLLGSFGEFFGAIAVVVTLIFLTLQIRQNTRQMRRVEMNAAHAQFNVPRMAIVSNRSVAELLLKARQAPDELDQVDQFQVDVWIGQEVWAVFHAWDRAQNGSFERELWEDTKPLVNQLFEATVGSSWWDQNRLSFNPAFRAEIDRVRDKHG